MKIKVILIITLFTVKTFSQTYQQFSDSTQHSTAIGNYKTALLWGEKALQQAEKEFGKKDTAYANTLTTLMDICFYSGNYEKGIAYTNEEITIRNEIHANNPLFYANSLGILASSYHAMGRYSQSEEYYLKTKDILKKQLGENHLDYAEVINNLAALYESMGRYPDAEELYLNSINILKTQMGETFPNYAISLDNLALLYANMGRYSEAEELHLKSKKILETYDKNHPDYATTINNLAMLYTSMGRYLEAEELYLMSKKIRKAKGENHPDYASSLNNLAKHYVTMKRYPEAEELFLITNKIWKTQFSETHPSYALTLNNLAGLYASIGRNTEAEELYLKTVKIRKDQLGENHPNYATSLNNLALLYVTMERYPEAEKLYLTAKNIWKTQLGENHPRYAQILNNLSGFEEKKGRYKESNTYFQQALQKYICQINTYFPGMSEKEKGQFFNTIKGKFEHYYSFGKEHFSPFIEVDSVANEWQKQIPFNMFNYRLVTKGLLFNSINKMRENTLNSSDTSLVQLFRTWKSKRDYFAKLFTLSKAEIEKQGINMDNLQMEINDIEKKLSKKSVLFDKETGKKEINWQDVQSQLKEGEAFVEMIRFRKYGAVTDTLPLRDSIVLIPQNGFTDKVFYAALILRSVSHLSKEDLGNDIKLVILENGNELQEMYYAGYKLAIKHLRPYPEGYVQYWERISKELKGINTVYFSADGVYNQINLNTLQNPQSGKYLLEEMNLYLITSSKDLLQNFNSKFEIQNSKTHKASLYGYVNYENNIASENLGVFPVLPGTQKEVTAIEKLFKEKKWTTKLYQWDQATERAVKHEQSPAVLHIATHGYFLSDQQIRGKKVLGIDSIYFSLNPLLKSGILLASDATLNKNEIKYSENRLGLYGKEEDGILTAYEAMNLNLDNTELVVLSACETGQGDVVAGEGVFGLQRAFQQAGAKSVVMSLWKVSDQHTEELMTLFYTKWLSGKNKTDAFKQTQAEMKAKYVHPYYWGAFVMVGS